MWNSSNHPFMHHPSQHNITTCREHPLGRRFCGSTTQKHADIAGVHAITTPREHASRQCTRRGLALTRSRHPANTHRKSSFLRLDNAKTRRGLAFTRSRHPANTHRGSSFSVSTTQKHADGSRSRDHDTPRTRRGLSFLRLDNAKHTEGWRSRTIFNQVWRLPPTLPRALKQSIFFKRTTHEVHHATPSIYNDDT